MPYKTQSKDFSPNYIPEFSLWQGKISSVHTAQDYLHSLSTSQDSLCPIRHSLWTFVLITSKNSASGKAKFPLYILHRNVYTLSLNFSRQPLPYKTQSLAFCPNRDHEFSLWQGKISSVHTAQNCVHSLSTSQDSLCPIRHSLWPFVLLTSKNSASGKAKFALCIGLCTLSLNFLGQPVHYKTQSLVTENSHRG